MNIKEIKVAGAVQVGNTLTAESVPAAGKDVMIDAFSAEGGFDPNTGVCLVWDHGGNDEEMVWLIRGSSQMPVKFRIAKSRVDGLKKLKIVLDNATGGVVHMAGYCRYSERD